MGLFVERLIFPLLNMNLDRELSLLFDGLFHFTLRKEQKYAFEYVINIYINCIADWIKFKRNKMPSKKENDEAKALKEKYKLNDLILCRTKDRTGLFYEAKIKGIIEENGETIFQVHYQGWNWRHDEDIPLGEVADRFQEYTPENREKAQQVGDCKELSLSLQCDICYFMHLIDVQK